MTRFPEVVKGAGFGSAGGMVDPATNQDATRDPPPTAGDDAVVIIPERAGQRIGPYKLLQRLGEGGFGSVFMAEREQPVKRQVALKIIKLGMDTRQVVARFEQDGDLPLQRHGRRSRPGA